MPYNGSGSYSPPAPPTFPAITGTTVRSDYFNAIINDIATALSNVLTLDGQKGPVGPINWNGQDITNVDDIAVQTISIAGVGFSPSNYLPLAGGNLSGNLFILGSNSLTLLGGTLFARNTLGTTSTVVQHDGSDGYVRSSTGSLYLGNNNVNRWEMRTSAFRPVFDNSDAIGGGANRPSEIFAVNPTINTSDETEKVWRGGITSAERVAALRIKDELGFYQWVDSVEEKGSNARLHFGVRAQRVWSIMAEEGLINPITPGIDPKSAYAFLCWDKWEAEASRAEILDEDGEILYPAYPGRVAGSRFGIRTEQLALFLLSALL